MDDGPARKKPKAEASPPTVFTFGASHSAARVQLLSRHTVYDLCDILCQCTAVGDGEGADSHMWNVDWQGRCYESGEFECMSSLRASQTTLGDLALPLNANLLWTYDYGSPARVQITLLANLRRLPIEAHPKARPAAGHGSTSRKTRLACCSRWTHVPLVLTEGREVLTPHGYVQLVAR